MNDSDRVTLERRGYVLLIGLNRPAERNLFDMQMIDALAAAYGQLEDDPELRCGVVFAHGKHFTLGLDLAHVAPVVAEAGGFHFPPGTLDPWGLRPPYRDKPLVCAVHGICLTVGLELALAADIRLAAQGTRFAQIEVKRGIFPDLGATLRFVREAGWGNAMRYLLTGDEFDAEEALRMGLIQEIVEPDRLLPRAVELAEIVAAQAPLGVRATIRAARQGWLEGEERAAAALFPAILQLFGTEDAQEGIRSFLERRAGAFKGR
jgi:enoyl-CoA hydratase